MKSIPVLLLLVLSGVPFGCASWPSPEAPPAVAEILYATDRARDDEAGSPEAFYGKLRGDFELGVATAEVDLREGRDFVASTAVERRSALDTGEKLVELVSIRPLATDRFLAELRRQLEAADDKAVLIYVHGYARTFAETMKRGTTFVERSGFAGVPVIWSWPSLGNAAAYVADSTNMTWSIPDFGRVLDLVARAPGVERVVIVAHSMGAYQVTQYIARLHDRGAPDGVLAGGELILVAPDIDADIFARDLVPALERAGLHITIYASSEDQALWASRTLHTYPRIGATDEEVRLIPGVDLIEVSDVSASFLGHNYHHHSAPVLNDIGELLSGMRDPAARTRLLRKERGAAVYWQLR